MRILHQLDDYDGDEIHIQRTRVMAPLAWGFLLLAMPCAGALGLYLGISTHQYALVVMGGLVGIGAVVVWCATLRAVLTRLQQRGRH